MFILLILLIGIPFIVITALNAVEAMRKERGAKRYMQVIGFSLLAIGGLGFFGTGLSSLIQLPKSFEWPIGWADQVISLDDGSIIALHEPSGRAQVYDEGRKFLHGWSVDASGGVFKGKAVGNGLIEIWTARGQKRFVFTSEGSAVEHGSYSPAFYEDLEVQSSSGWIPIFFPLWVFAHPFIAWGVVMAGMILLISGDKIISKRSNKTREATAFSRASS